VQATMFTWKQKKEPRAPKDSCALGGKRSRVSRADEWTVHRRGTRAGIKTLRVSIQMRLNFVFRRRAFSNLATRSSEVLGRARSRYAVDEEQRPRQSPKTALGTRAAIPGAPW
jgi:hypothetical protein